MKKDCLFPYPKEKIAHYTAYRVDSALLIDGDLTKEAWLKAPRSPRFVDLIHDSKTIHDTKAAVLWDEHYLYVAYWIEEPFVQAKFTERDSLIYEDNDVELFIAGQDGYYEFEINAFNTIYEVFFLWEDAYEAKGYNKLAEFNRNNKGVEAFDGVGFKHPRGKRIGFWNWDYPELKTAVKIDGTLNDNSDRDRGWTVELALPWQGLKHLADGRSLPPKEGDTWRMDFSRFNQYKEAAPAKDSGGWAWSSHGVWDSHIPECFPFIHFSEASVLNLEES